MPDDPGQPQAGVEPADSAARHELCETCGVAVALDQRYCVNCGTRLSAVTDPAAEYLGRASVNARAVASAATRARRRRSGPRLTTAVAVAVVPLAVAIGIGIGRSSNGGDAQLGAKLQAQSHALQAALRAEHSGTNGHGSKAGSTRTAAGGTSAASKHSHTGSAKPKSTSTTSRSSGTTSTSKRTSSGQATTSAPTKKQLSEGAAATHKDQSATGSGYVNSQKGLPNTVVVP
jgi:hypothetical protein